jgi:hypothetical protein
MPGIGGPCDSRHLIYPTRRGYVDFALPYLREYLRQHSVIGA